MTRGLSLSAIPSENKHTHTQYTHFSITEFDDLAQGGPDGGSRARGRMFAVVFACGRRSTFRAKLVIGQWQRRPLHHLQLLAVTQVRKDIPNERVPVSSLRVGFSGISRVGSTLVNLSTNAGFPVWPQG